MPIYLIFFTPDKFILQFIQIIIKNEPGAQRAANSRHWGTSASVGAENLAARDNGAASQRAVLCPIDSPFVQ